MDGKIIDIYKKEITFDKPIFFNELTFYPVQVIDYLDFYMSISCLLLDQYNDPEAKDNLAIYQMSYLEYLLYIIDNYPEKFMITLLTKLFSICLKKDLFLEKNRIKVFYDEKGKPVLEIDNQLINHKKFKEIRQIICGQNDIDLTIFDLDPRVRFELQKTMDYQQSHSKSEMASLEDQLVCVLISSSLNKDEIEQLTIRKFKKILERVDHKMHYEIYTLSQMSGFVKLKSEYPHWLCKLDKGDVTKNITSYDDIVNTPGIAQS